MRGLQDATTLYSGVAEYKVVTKNGGGLGPSYMTIYDVIIVNNILGAAYTNFDHLREFQRPLFSQWNGSEN